MSSPEKNWKRAPVIEVVAGIQFDPLPGLTNGHLGWFWEEMIDTYPKSDDAQPIQPVLELLDGELSVDFPSLSIRHLGGESRLRMKSEDGSKMIQVQNGWLVANWAKKGDCDYPGFSGVKALFDDAFKRFSAFVAAKKLGQLRPNMWEVTYIDHIPMGTVWQTVADVSTVFPGLFGKGDSPHGSRESVDATWTWTHSMSGRLRMTVQSAKLAAEPRKPILLVRSIARGALLPDNQKTLDESLNFGRSLVVDTFIGLASDSAVQYWIGN